MRASKTDQPRLDMTDGTGDRTGTEHPLVVSQRTLLDESGLQLLDLEQAFGCLLIGSVDAADLYLQRSCSESWVLAEGIVKDGQFSLNQGIGVRAISQDKQGFAYSDAIRLPAMLDACRAARSIVRSGDDGHQQVLVAAGPKPLYASTDP
jgi:TldD protein